VEVSQKRVRGGLRCLSMSNTGLTVDGVKMLCQGLSGSDSLEVLELDNCQMNRRPSVSIMCNRELVMSHLNKLSF
jgi:hypothetical protein